MEDLFAELFPHPAEGSGSFTVDSQKIFKVLAKFGELEHAVSALSAQSPLSFKKTHFCQFPSLIRFVP
jgi:hypothetical protein